MKVLIFALALALAACTSIGSNEVKPDPAVVAKIKYVCAYSGLFKFGTTELEDLIAVPGVGVGISESIRQICLHPEEIALGVADVKALIVYFKSLGKM